MIEFDIIWGHFLWTFLLLRARNVQLDFCVFEELCFALFLDSGFRIPDSGFWFPDSGFRLLGLPVVRPPKQVFIFKIIFLFVLYYSENLTL